MAEGRSSTLLDLLFDVVKDIQKSLQCPICLEMMSLPVKTKCGHTFCRTCIGTVLNKKNVKCPMCNANLHRRSISKDGHTERCINKFQQLVRHIQIDSNVDILSYTKNPHNTREGYPTPEVARQRSNSTGSKKKGNEKISSFFTKMTPGEQFAGPSNRDILDETSASCSGYKKDNPIKKDDSVQRRKGWDESSSDELSGVCPLLCSPSKNKETNDEAIFPIEKRIDNWLKMLPETKLLQIPDQHLAQPGNTTRENWNTVVQFGKEMRTKRRKVKSLDVSVQSTSCSRLSEEFASHRTTTNRKIPSTNLQIRSKRRNDANEKLDKSNTSPPKIQASYDSKEEQNVEQSTSFISLDEEGRVPIRSLRPDQMNDIIGIGYDRKEVADDTRTNLPSTSNKKTCVNKLGKVIKKRRHVKFYKRGSLTRVLGMRTLSSLVSNLSKINMTLPVDPQDTQKSSKTTNADEYNLKNETPGPSLINPIDVVDKRNDFIKSPKHRSESQDSLDVLLFSINDEVTEKKINFETSSEETKYVSSDRNKIRIPKQNDGCSKPMITNVTRIMSTKIDPRLTFSHLNSPNTVPERTFVQTMIKSERNTSHKDPTNSSEQSNVVLCDNSKKRKRMPGITDKVLKDNVCERIKKSNIYDFTCESDSELVKAGCSRDDIISTSSDESVCQSKQTKYAPKKLRKQYKRIVLPSSSSESPKKETSTINDRKNVKNVSVMKRKRLPSVDSDSSDNVAKGIVTGWCNDLDTSNKISIKGRLERTKVSEATSSKTAVLSPQSLRFETWLKSLTPIKRAPEKDLHDRSNNDIIEKEKLTEMNENIKSISEKTQNTMDDYSDEAIALTMANSLETPSKNEENRFPLTASYVEMNDFFADFDKTLVESSNGSNKENVKSEESKNKNQAEETKQNYEYDSLMNVTQDQLLLKELEADLFGPANSRSLATATTTKTSLERRLEGETRTSRKLGMRNLGNKDTGSSSDEEDIIENTPQSQKKFMEVDHVSQSKARKSLNVSQTTPVSRKNFKTTTTTMTPSTLVGKLKTPIDQNKLRPLYQSTPKIIQPTCSREKEPSKFVEENKKVLESITDSKERSVVLQAKDESTSRTKRNKRQLCFVWSSLAVNQIERIKELAVLFDATCTLNFTPAVTHVIIGTKEENNGATKTLKFLQGIAYRKFIVSFKWVTNCLQEGRLLDEEPYEAVDCYTLEPGPRKSRLRQSDLFNGFAFLCVKPFPNITVTEFQDLLKKVGATIVQNIDELVAAKDMYKVILLQNEAHKDENVLYWYRRTGAVPVSCDWIVECISQYKLISCYMYLHEIVPEDILNSGYPEEMINPEEFNSTCDTTAEH